jgi:alpha-1,2-mannosyltransferase
MTERPAQSPAAGGSRVGLYAGLSLLALLLPVALARSGWPWLGATAKGRQVFELFGFTESLALLAILWREHRRSPLVTLRRAVGVIAPILVSFLTLMVLVEAAAERSWDYRCYERAAKALWQGENPYAGTRYLYPPLTAQVLSGLHSLVLLSHGSATPAGEARWLEVFYLYQASQIFLVQLAYLLLVRLLRQLGLAGARASVLTALLLCFNNPLFRTLEFNQVNLWVLVPVLAALVGYRRYPMASGVALALGAHVKLYPLLLAGALGVLGRYRAVAGAIVGVLAILAGQLWLSGTSAWLQYFQAARTLPAVELLRDSSLRGITASTIRLLVPGAAPALPYLVGVELALVLGWLGWRFLRRQTRTRGESAAGIAPPEASDGFEMATAVDSIAAMLLLSPMVWEHHYVLALPVAAFALATRRRRHPRAVWLGTALIFVLPTFDVWIASAHRLAGLLLLMWATEPDRPTRPAAAPASAGR